VSAYRVRIWCHDCFGEDPMGCFGGEDELLEDVYETQEAAEAAGDEACDNGVYRFEVVPHTPTPSDGGGR
jgi:hypothetical protein